MMQVLRLATRQSRLALWQAEHVATLLRAAHSDLHIQLVPMTTQADRTLDRPLAEFGGKGLFVKELELALREDRADIAVHSMKDVPSELPADMMLAAMLARAEPRDAFVSLQYRSLTELPYGARVGTSSPRRQAQLKNRRPDLKTMLLRGNVETRLRKLDEAQYDAIILAAAGLERLGLSQRVTELLEIDAALPAVGQGIIGVECRANDVGSIERVRVIDHPAARICCMAERAFARRLAGNCHSPIAAFATIEAEHVLRLRGFVGALDGARTYRGELSGSTQQAESLGTRLAERLLEDGAAAILDQLRVPAP